MLKIYWGLEDRKHIIVTPATCRNCKLLLSPTDTLTRCPEILILLPTFVHLLHITIPQTSNFLVTPKC